MIGELFNAMAEELTGSDPENKRIAGLPYLAAKTQAGLGMVTTMLAPMMMPTPG